MIYKLKPLSCEKNYLVDAIDSIYKHIDSTIFQETAGTILVGNIQAMISADHYFSGLRDNVPNTITFCHCKPKETIENAIHRLEKAEQSVVLLPYIFHKIAKPKKHQLFIFLISEDPAIVFARMMANSVIEVYPKFKRPEDFPKSCYVGPGVHVAEDVEIGENVRLIGNIFIYSGVKIGNNVIVKPNTVIGGEGFEKDYDPKMDCIWHWPHMASVIIEDNVQIGSCVCIDRGMFKDTIIHRGAMLDNLIHVAHSVEIGENARIVASTMIAGSVKIGARAWVATSIIKNGITLGDECYIGLGSVVVKDIPAGKLAFGVPAKVKE
jgi:UDP-3-O-[3-hydroxymyristoyl] glucosamine N-acyltransferase